MLKHFPLQLKLLHTKHTKHTVQINVYWPIKPFSGLAIKFFHYVCDNNGISNLSTQIMTLPSFQEDSGGPLMCSHKNKYTLVGIISSGKG